MSESPSLNVHIRRKAFDVAGPLVIGDLDFSVAAGEIVSIVGPSGAGKSTLLAMIAGLDDVYDGKIARVHGATTRENTTTAYTDVAYVFQEPRLMPWLNARENVALVLEGEEDDRVLRLLKSVGLENFADYYPGQLSGGMQRRLALIRAFIVEPTLLLLDEPFVSLDAPTAEQLRAQLHALWTMSQPSVIFVTHQLDEAIAVADRVLFLSTGPATIIHELTVDLPRPRSVADDAVVALRTQLLGDYPGLLTGNLTGAG